MNAQELLLNRLKQPYTVDEWSEYVIDDAVSIANQLSDADWSELCSSWSILDAIQQVRIAQIASGIDSRCPDVVTMLIQMLASSDADVLEASLDSINSLLQSNASFIPLNELRNALGGVVINDNTGKAILNRVKELLDKRSSKTAGQ